MVTCPLCGNETTYFEEYQQWYCSNCKAYQKQIEEALRIHFERKSQDEELIDSEMDAPAESEETPTEEIHSDGGDAEEISPEDEVDSDLDFEDALGSLEDIMGEDEPSSDTEAESGIEEQSEEEDEVAADVYEESAEVAEEDLVEVSTGEEMVDIISEITTDNVQEQDSDQVQVEIKAEEDTPGSKDTLEITDGKNCQNCGYLMESDWIICPECMSLYEEPEEVPSVTDEVSLEEDHEVMKRDQEIVDDEQEGAEAVEITPEPEPEPEMVTEARQPTYDNKKKNPNYWLVLAMINIRKNNLNKSIQAIQRALKLDESNHLAWYLRSSIYKMMGEYEKEGKCMDKIFQNNSTLVSYSQIITPAPESQIDDVVPVIQEEEIVPQAMEEMSFEPTPELDSPELNISTEIPMEMPLDDQVESMPEDIPSEAIEEAPVGDQPEPEYGEIPAEVTMEVAVPYEEPLEDLSLDEKRPTPEEIPVEDVEESAFNYEEPLEDISLDEEQPTHEEIPIPEEILAVEDAVDIPIDEVPADFDEPPEDVQESESLEVPEPLLDEPIPPEAVEPVLEEVAAQVPEVPSLDEVPIPELVPQDMEEKDKTEETDEYMEEEEEIDDMLGDLLDDL